MYSFYVPIEIMDYKIQLQFASYLDFCPPLFVKLICPSICLFVRHKILNLAHLYLACMILVTSHFNWHHAMTLTY